MFGRKAKSPAKVTAKKNPSERDTLERIEAVTDRLEWLAKEIEYQLKHNPGGAT